MSGACSFLGYDPIVHRVVDAGRVEAFAAQAAEWEAGGPEATISMRPGTFTYDPSGFEQDVLSHVAENNKTFGPRVMRYLGRWAGRGAAETTPAGLHVIRSPLARRVGFATVQVYDRQEWDAPA
jgi:hypothetical protein